MKTKLLTAVALVAASFAPVTFATPAFAEEGDSSLCSSPNKNIIWQTETYGGEDVTEVGTAAPAGNSGNVFVHVTIKSGPTFQDCNAYNTKSGNAVPGQNETGIIVDAGGDILDEYDVKVCQNIAHTGTVVTAEGTAMGFTQSQCEALTA